MEPHERVAHTFDRVGGRDGSEHGIVVEDWELGHGAGTILSPAW
jgi:hypothetical protein